MLSAVITCNKQPRTVHVCNNVTAWSAVRIWYQCDVTEQRCAVVTSCETTAAPHLMRTIVIHTWWRHSYSRNTLAPKLEFRYPGQSCEGPWVMTKRHYLLRVCAYYLYTGFKRIQLPFTIFFVIINLYSVENNLQQWMSFAIWSLQPTLY